MKRGGGRPIDRTDIIALTDPARLALEVRSVEHFEINAELPIGTGSPAIERHQRQAVL